MKQHDETVSNTSSNPCFTQILVERLSRRRLLQGGLVAAGMTMLHGPLVSGRGQRAEAAGALFSFPRRAGVERGYSRRAAWLYCRSSLCLGRSYRRWASVQGGCQ